MSHTYSHSSPQYQLQSANLEDAHWIAELRAIVLKEDLTRLERYDDVRVRQRFLNSFQPQYTQLIVVDSQAVGCVALRPAPDAGYVLEHFYIHPDQQGQGIGGAILAHLLSSHELRGQSVILNVLQGSPARRLYERHGFRMYEQDEVDVWMKRILDASTDG
ncbi:GNAT family N-acetyltransferase [Paenibacillus sp. WLX1005]|uniref:GNAT family N-acetyltransferase n=1 Tax=unclassified Paenibacillus TaxID=185978 RepID=UPI00398423F3